MYVNYSNLANIPIYSKFYKFFSKLKKYLTIWKYIFKNGLINS